MNKNKNGKDTDPLGDVLWISMHFGIECLFSSHVYMKFTECQLEVWNQGSTQKLQVFLTLHQVALAS